MYLSYYGMDREPFGVTPDPDFLYLGPTHREALATILYGIRCRKGFICVTGEVGMGKTTALRSALERLQSPDMTVLYIFHPNVTFGDLLKNILQELGIERIPTTPQEMVRRLHYALIEEYSAGRNVVLVIDEAQNVPSETLENLRMLSNIETTKEKLLQIVLCGQPELEEKLRSHKLRQLRQRIAVRAVIKPLTPEESEEYIRHRLVRANAPRVWMFTQRAKEKIIAQCKGNPRVINILCDNVLMCGFGSQQRVISSQIVDDVVADLFGKSRELEPSSDEQDLLDPASVADSEFSSSPSTSVGSGRRHRVIDGVGESGAIGRRQAER